MGKSVPPSTDKLQVIDLVRTFSILSVLACHLVGIAPSGSSFQWLWKPFSVNGVYGVCVFFVVSGFLITRLIDGKNNQLFDPGVRSFYVRRVARILPLLIIHVGIGAYIVHNVTHFQTLFWISIFTFFFNWFQAFYPNPMPGIYWGLLWSLAVEEQFYFFYPMVLKNIGRLKTFVSLLLGIIVFGLLWRSGMLMYPSKGRDFFYKTSFGAFDQIAFGILLYMASKRFRNCLSTHKTFSILLCGVGISLLIGVYFFTNMNERIMDDIYGPTLVALGAFSFILGGLHLNFFESKYLSFLSWTGKFSYGIYLFHPLIYSRFFYPFIYYPFLRNQNIFIVFSIFAILSTGIMAASYYLFEMPVNRFIRYAFQQ